MSRLKVVVVDDSEVCRTLLREILESEHDIEVVAEAADGLAALDVIAREKPDLATVDIQMPGLGGLDVIERVMADSPVPLLVVTGLPTSPDGRLVFEALRRGALDVVEKPGRERTRAANALRERVRLLAKVSVVRHVAGLRHRRPSHPGMAPGAVPISDFGARPRPRLVRVVAIGASAGGPQAVASVLSHIPADFPACIALIQHIPPGFIAPFSRFLTSSTKLDVQIVERSAPCAPGKLLIAGDDRHLVAEEKGTFIAVEGPLVCGHRPSVTALLRSVAKVFGANAVGVVLTGIGDDGSAGLLEMKNAGAITIAQDEATSTVYGMPKAAFDAGAAGLVLALDRIGPELLRLVPRTVPRTDPGGSAPL